MKKLNPSTGRHNLSVEATCYQKSLSVACVIVGFDSRSPKILLTRTRASRKWMLPSSLVMRSENTDDAARRVISAYTTQTNVTAYQFRLFGDNDRLTKNELATIMDLHGLSDTDSSEDVKRIVTMGYYSLVDMRKIDLSSNPNVESKWFLLTKMPELFGDDRNIVKSSIDEIRRHGHAIPIEKDVLPDYFTIEDLRSVYEQVFQKDLDARNFERKVLSKGYISKMSGYTDIGKARLFYFNWKKFNRRADLVFWI